MPAGRDRGVPADGAYSLTAEQIHHSSIKREMSNTFNPQSNAAGPTISNLVAGWVFSILYEEIKTQCLPPAAEPISSRGPQLNGGDYMKAKT